MSDRLPASATIAAETARLSAELYHLSPQALRLQRLLKRARRRVSEMDPADYRRTRVAERRHWLVLDVREYPEWRRGYIEHAMHLPRGLLELWIEGAEPDPARRIVCYCADGSRSLLAAENLARLGYRDVWSLKGGLAHWVSLGLPLATRPPWH